MLGLEGGGDPAVIRGGAVSCLCGLWEGERGEGERGEGERGEGERAGEGCRWWWWEKRVWWMKGPADGVLCL